MSQVEYADRYSALNMPLPDPKNMCLGNCEGTGWVPVKKDTTNSTYKELWLQAEAVAPSDDDYHFIKCPTCLGSGKRAVAENQTWQDLAEKSLAALENIVAIQTTSGNWNYDPYMHGMANGLLLALHIMKAEDGEPKYLDAPEQWLKDHKH